MWPEDAAPRPPPTSRPPPFRAGLEQEDDTELGPEEEHKLARWGMGRRGEACKAQAPNCERARSTESQEAGTPSEATVVARHARIRRAPRAGEERGQTESYLGIAKTGDSLDMSL